MTDSTCCDAAVAVPPPTVLGPRVLVPAALFALYLIWGSTYLAIRVALESYPPFLMAGTRFLIAGGAFYAFLRWRGMAAPTPGAMDQLAGVTGTLLLGMGNGFVCFAEQSVTSGLAAVAVAAMPLFAALFGGLYGQWPRRMEWFGLAVGLAGVVLLNLGGGMAAAPVGAIALLVAAMTWAFGSVWSRRRDMPPAAYEYGRADARRRHGAVRRCAAVRRTVPGGTVDGIDALGRLSRGDGIAGCVHSVSLSSQHGAPCACDELCVRESAGRRAIRGDAWGRGRACVRSHRDGGDPRWRRADRARARAQARFNFFRRQQLCAHCLRRNRRARPAGSASPCAVRIRTSAARRPRRSNPADRLPTPTQQPASR